MIHYHGTPMGGKRDEIATWAAGRDLLVPWARPEDLGIALEACRSVVLDNSAFSFWKTGEPCTDWSGYYKLLKDLALHPRFSWGIIPDVIDGTEADNDALIDQFDKKGWFWIQSGGLRTKKYPAAVPVWHLHESLARLCRLCARWPVVALGSSGEWSRPGTAPWWQRMSAAMNEICDKHGRPPCKLHGLRMLSPEIFTGLPLYSADSTNVARNSHSVTRHYIAPSRTQRMEVISNRIESHNSRDVWEKRTKQLTFMESAWDQESQDDQD